MNRNHIKYIISTMLLWNPIAPSAELKISSTYFII